MSIAILDIETKDNGALGPGATGTSHKLTAEEFNRLVLKVNELIGNANKRVYLTQEEYETLVANDTVEEDVEYNVIEE